MTWIPPSTARPAACISTYTTTILHDLLSTHPDNNIQQQVTIIWRTLCTQSTTSPPIQLSMVILILYDGPCISIAQHPLHSILHTTHCVLGLTHWYVTSAHQSVTMPPCTSHHPPMTNVTSPSLDQCHITHHCASHHPPLTSTRSAYVAATISSLGCRCEVSKMSLKAATRASWNLLDSLQPIGQPIGQAMLRDGDVRCQT